MSAKLTASGRSAMGLGLEDLADLARAIEGLSEVPPEVARRASRLAERIDTARYHIAVLGDFKRGKSTLVNALVGRAFLPTGVVPLTSVATEVHVDGSETVVVFDDGSRRVIDTGELADYVTEKGNPSNSKGIDRVEVGVSTDFGVPGLVLVDTPGLSSVNERNSEEARRALLDTDGAIVVLGAESPLSASELALLDALGGLRARVFLVINRCDALSDSELNEVRDFVADRVSALMGQPVRPFCLSARLALEGVQGTATNALEFDQFRAVLDRFVEDELGSARRAAAASELGRLGQDLERRLRLEEAADAMEFATLNESYSLLNEAVEQGRRLLDEDIVILGHDVASLLADLDRQLGEQARSAARDSRSELAAAMAELPRAQLDRGSRDAIEVLVRSYFEPIRDQVSEQVESRWTALAGRFTERVQTRVNDLVETASDLFALHLPTTEVPLLQNQRARFSYYFDYLESQNAVIGHALSRLIPTAIARRRALRAATIRLRQELDKHAGRARYDLAERLRAATAELTSSMQGEFEDTQASLVAACAEARARRELGVTARRARAEQRIQWHAVVQRIKVAPGGEPG